MKITNYLFISLLPLNIACNDHKDVAPSADVNQDKIYTSYFLQYDEASNKSTAYAQFFFNSKDGTSIKLSTASSVNFNSTPLAYTESVLDFITGPHYLKDFTGFASPDTFVYTNDQGKTYQNTVSVNTIQAGAINTFSKANSFYYTFTGASLALNEYMELTISDANGKTAYMYGYTVVGNSMLVEKSRLDSLSVGTGSIQLVRYSAPVLSAMPQAGGKVLTKHIPKPVLFILK